MTATRNGHRVVKTISSKSKAYQRRKFEESVLTELSELTEKLPSVEDRCKAYNLIWALREYLRTIMGEFRVRDHS